MSNSYNQTSELGRRGFMSRMAKTALGVGVGAPFMNPALATTLPNTDKRIEQRHVDLASNI